MKHQEAITRIRQVFILGPQNVQNHRTHGKPAPRVMPELLAVREIPLHKPIRCQWVSRNLVYGQALKLSLIDEHPAQSP